MWAVHDAARKRHDGDLSLKWWYVEEGTLVAASCVQLQIRAGAGTAGLIRSGNMSTMWAFITLQEHGLSDNIVLVDHHDCLFAPRCGGPDGSYGTDPPSQS